MNAVNDAGLLVRRIEETTRYIIRVKRLYGRERESWPAGIREQWRKKTNYLANCRKRLALVFEEAGS